MPPKALLRADKDNGANRLATETQLTGVPPEAAAVVPWEPARLRLYRTIFPQMTHWLPDEEAGQFRFAFEEEMARLKAA